MPLRILVVDDELITCRTIAHCLEHAGHECTQAHSALGAIGLMRGGAFDLALIDFELNSSLTGAHVAQHANDRGIPSILVTGHDPATIREAYASWTHDPLKPFWTVIGKPLSLDHLLAEVEQVERSQRKTDPGRKTPD